jgi:hypothetical protein
LRDTPKGRNESQIQGYKSQLIGKVVNAVHDQAETLSLESGDRLNDKDRGIEHNSSRDGFSIMGHGSPSTGEPIGWSAYRKAGVPLVCLVGDDV